eukprot:TRINITY_DN67716_c9_g1_i4.p1 TRINITY_DN67716_c9_g1~~TRINITY_DN67716_c9_g1_i4.p1  ORF type:complete len:166 (-),score=82.97 TRINITY_DN67716_c9_g1_i4:359-856(-)
MIGFVVGAVETGGLAPEVSDALKADDNLYSVFTGLYGIITSAVRGKVKDQQVARDLKNCQVPQPYLDDVTKAIANKREALEKASESKRITLPTVEGVNWRIDVTISTTTLLRVFKPTIIMRLTLSDGKIRTFECPVDKFHQLRYSVAKVLKDMQDVARHPMIMIE